MMSEFYVYSHRVGSAQSPFYVGKGCGQRAYVRSGRSQAWLEMVAEFGDFDVVIERDGLSDAEAKKYEAELINRWGLAAYGGLLVNVSVRDTKPDVDRPRRRISGTFSPALLERLDKWIAAQELPPSFTAVVELALREFLEKRDG